MRTFLTGILLLLATAVTGQDDVLTIAMAGDIMMGTTYPVPMLPANDGASLFRDVGPVLRQADLAVGNLEGTLLDEDVTTDKDDKPNHYAFRTPTAFARRLKEAGFDFLSMANNHAHDFGEDGIRSTEHCLDSLGIRYAGLVGRGESTVIERRGKRIGLCAFGHNYYTLSHLSLRTVKRVLDGLAGRCDLVVVSFHGGAEGSKYSHLPDSMETFLSEERGYLRRLAHFCVDHGADVVYGHGPHVVRATEVYKGRFIAYSLGNFCTPYGISVKGVAGYAPVIEITIDGQGRFRKGRIHSFVQTRGVGPRKDPQHRAATQIRRLSMSDVPESEARIDAEGNLFLNGY